MVGIEKAFGGTRALNGVSFDVERGAVHALLGGNGSGKSTAIKIMAGVVTADAGSIEVKGTEVAARSFRPADAREAGLRFVHQESRNFPDLTVAENLAIGSAFETGWAGRVRWRAVSKRTAEVLDRFHIAAEPDTRLGRLSPATQTMVAVARVLQDRDASGDCLLVMDEPTAALPAREVDSLLSALKRYANAGCGVLFVTHRLEEAVEIADRATVLRDGRVVGMLEGDRLTDDALVRLIAGRAIDATVGHGDAHANGNPEVIRASRVAAGPVRDASLVVHSGEVVGLAGLLGSGRSTLLRVLFGDVSIESGELRLGREVVTFRGPRDAMRAGVAYVPEDRNAEGAFPGLSVGENMALAVLGSYWRRGRLRWRAMERDTRNLMNSYLIRASSDRAELGTLSGGNQQKAVIARWLRRNPRLVLLDDPTQGVDVAARAEIWALVRQIVEAGAGVLVASSDFDELQTACDRVIIMERGRTVREVAGPQLKADHVHALVHGFAAAA